MRPLVRPEHDERRRWLQFGDVHLECCVCTAQRLDESSWQLVGGRIRIDEEGVTVVRVTATDHEAAAGVVRRIDLADDVYGRLVDGEGDLYAAAELAQPIHRQRRSDSDDTGRARRDVGFGRDLDGLAMRGAQQLVALGRE